jgi:hypothetical protein
VKHVKMLGLAAVATIALMAFAASTASATTLKSGGSTVTSFEASLAESAKLTDTSGTVLDTCTVGGISFQANADSAGGELKGSGTITHGAKGAGCAQTTDTLNNGTFGITWINGTISGTVKSYGYEVTAELAGVSCGYGTSASGTTLGTLVGSETSNATLEINIPLEFKFGPFLCPRSVVWRAKYIVTNPNPFRVVQ